MYAVIKTGGKQYKVAVGQIIKVEKLDVAPGDQVNFDQVLMVKQEDGSIQVGNPLVAELVVHGEVLRQGRGKKIVVYKYKRRKNERKKQGHRQAFTQIRIDAIGTPAEIEAFRAANRGSDIENIPVEPEAAE